MQGFIEENQVVHGITHDGLYHIKINRPEKRNALNHAMFETISKCMKYAESSEKVKVVLMYGAKGLFCSGFDLDDFLQLEPL